MSAASELELERLERERRLAPYLVRTGAEGQSGPTASRARRARRPVTAVVFRAARAIPDLLAAAGLVAILYAIDLLAGRPWTIGVAGAIGIALGWRLDRLRRELAGTGS